MYFTLLGFWVLHFYFLHYDIHRLCLHHHPFSLQQDGLVHTSKVGNSCHLTKTTFLNCIISVFTNFTIRIVKLYSSWFSGWAFLIHGFELSPLWLNLLFLYATIAMLGVELGVLCERILSSCLIFVRRSINVGQFAEFRVIVNADHEGEKSPRRKIFSIICV